MLCQPSRRGQYTTQNGAELWTTFLQAWVNFATATEVDKKLENAQVGVLITFMGTDDMALFAMYQWTNLDDAEKIRPVMERLV